MSVVSGLPPKFDGWEVVRRARSRIGEQNYRLLTNNCEHLCERCLRGQHRSYQIDACLALPARAREMTQRLIAQLLWVGPNWPPFLSRSRHEPLLRPMETDSEPERNLKRTLIHTKAHTLLRWKPSLDPNLADRRPVNAGREGSLRRPGEGNGRA